MTEVEFNTVDFVESRLLPKPATKSRRDQDVRRTSKRCHSVTHFQLCKVRSYYVIDRTNSMNLFNTSRHIRLTLLPVLTTNRQQLGFDSLLWSTSSPTRSTLSPECFTSFRLYRECVRVQSNTVLNSTLLPVCTGLEL